MYEKLNACDTVTDSEKSFELTTARKINDNPIRMICLKSFTVTARYMARLCAVNGFSYLICFKKRKHNESMTKFPNNDHAI